MGDQTNSAAVTAETPPATKPIRLIDDWRLAWRFWSLRLMGAALLVASWPEAFLHLYALVPADLQYLLPGRDVVVVVCLVLAFVARMIKQPAPRKDASHAAS